MLIGSVMEANLQGMDIYLNFQAIRRLVTLPGKEYPQIWSLRNGVGCPQGLRLSVIDAGAN